MQEEVKELETAEKILESAKVVIDEKKIEDLKKKVEELYEELNKKVYAVSMNTKELETLSEIINDVEWKGKEALGILEIGNKLNTISKEGIKSGVVFLSPLEVEASHYFLNKYTGKGRNNAENFMKVYKSLDLSLTNVRRDNKEYEDLTKDLAAAQQGITSV